MCMMFTYHVSIKHISCCMLYVYPKNVYFHICVAHQNRLSVNVSITKFCNSNCCHCSVEIDADPKPTFGAEATLILLKMG